MIDPPSTKLPVFSAVICSTLTKDILAFSGEWTKQWLQDISVMCVKV